MIAIIFGSNGQDGFYMTQLLTSQGVKVIGVSRTGNDIIGDVCDRKFINDLISLYQPNYVFHFAAKSTTRHEALFDNHDAISTGSLNILEAVYRGCPTTKVFLSGSAVQFENKELPIDESTPFAPLSPYAVSRIHSAYAGRYYRSLGIKVYIGYFFNHDSPLRTEQHVNQKIAKAVCRIAKGSEEVIELGNIDVQKEFNYAGDVVNAVWKLVNQDIIFETIIGSGKTYRIQDWLAYCFKKINKNWEDLVVIKQDFVPEYKILVSNPQLLKSLGWQPTVDFYQLADMMMHE